MTALVNWGVPVALVTTPQFQLAQKRTEKLTGWNSDQFQGRIGHLERLPKALGKADLVEIAQVLLPELDHRAAEALAEFAGRSSTRLGSIEAISKRARWFAHQAGRQSVTAEDVRTVMRERIRSFDDPTTTILGGEEDPLAGTRRNGRGYHADGSRSLTAGLLKVHKVV
jgi:histone H3/H4